MHKNYKSSNNILKSMFERVGWKMINFNTDLAVERNDIYRKANNIEDKIEGIETEEEEISETLKISRVKIVNEKGAEALGKPIGNYITLDIKKLKLAEVEDIQKAAELVTKELKELIDKHAEKQGDILIVGLGNAYVTPDSLGPKVVKDIDITRHLLKYAPEYIDPSTRPVTAIAPGVLGTTGIETVEIIKGIVDNIKPKLIIVIDSLSSKSIERISSTVQIADTGIVPGAGVGNARNEISKNTLNIPVIAIGVPMVVEAATIASDSIDLFIEKLQQEAQSNEYLNQLKDVDKYELIREALAPKDYNLIVTPKEIDDLIENMKDVLARGINFALQG